MKKLMLIAVIGTVAMASVPSHAYVRTVAQRKLTFVAPIACTAICPDITENDGCTMDDPTVLVSASDIVVKVPSHANFMILTAHPELDWDLVVCRQGKNLGHSANGLESPETIGFFVEPGYSYRLRAWNWADVTSLTGKVVFKRIT